MATIIPLAQHRTADNPLERLTALVAEDMAAVNRLIVQKMESPVPLIPQLAGHLIAAGGKRLRPLLTVACARLFDNESSRAHKLAASIEFIHTATLLHDDVVDASFLRRGEPSANAVFGNQASVLVGDFLFSRGFQLMVEDGSLDALRILSNASAVISEGEVMQLSSAGDNTLSEQMYLDVIRAKTAELFAAACRIGAVIANRPATEEEALRSFGLNLGIAFQIVDDVLDYTADEDRLGKDIGNDFKEGKRTLPVILSIHRGTAEERGFWQRALNTPEQQTEDDFIQAIDLLHRHNALRDSIDRARHYGSIARDALGLFPDSPLKQALLGIVDFTVERGF